MRADVLKKTLCKIYDTYHKPDLIENDPVTLVRRFSSPREKEIAGLVASSLAYGRVERILYAIGAIFDLAGSDLVSFVNNTSYQHKKRCLQRFRHRFNSGADIATLLEAVKTALRNYGSLEKMFNQRFSNEDESIQRALDSFTGTLKEYGLACAGADRAPSFEFLLPSPRSGGACKRMNMYLRWMIREDDGIDCGVWKSVSPALLIMPVDVHIARVARSMGLSRRKTADWTMAEEITGVLKKITPGDPVKYDFSLYKFGMNTMKTGANR